MTKIKSQTTHGPAFRPPQGPSLGFTGPTSILDQAAAAVRSASDDGLQRSVVSTKSAREG